MWWTAISFSHKMKKTEALAVGDILKAMIESDGDTAVLDRQKINFLWSEVVGPVINRATIRRYVEGDTLHVFISSAPLKSELAFMAPGLTDKLNEAVGKKIIRRIAIH